MQSHTLEEIFHIAKLATGAERVARLRELCGDDARLFDDAQSLLAAHDDAANDEHAALNADAAAWAAPSAPSVPNTRLGAWQVVGELGSGGMGTVFHVRRADGRFQLEAALKRVRTDVAPAQLAELAARFRAERQHLAELDHPGIARLLDGGEDEHGMPWLAMELVRGEPIHRWAARNGASRELRVDLVREVCASVHHAHQRLIAHRDLKPSNIFVVTDGDGEPHTKLLDFGIARLLADAREGGDPTTLGASRMTPAYASPEQVRGGRVGAPSDVYALGVVLYELLLDRLPYELHGGTPHEIVLAVSERPHVPARRVDPRFPRDLEAILDKALEKEPARRYASAVQLADDLERWRTGHPIMARPAGPWDHGIKLVRRHRIPAALLGLLLVAVTGSGVWLWILYGRARASEVLAESRRLDAERRTDMAERTVRVFEDVLSAPRQPFDTNVQAEIGGVLDRNVPDALLGLEHDKAQQARLFLTAGRRYAALQRDGDAEAFLREAVVSTEQYLGKDSLELVQARLALAPVLVRAGFAAEAERLLVDALEDGARHLEDDPTLSIDLEFEHVVALAALGRCDEAERRCRAWVASTCCVPIEELPMVGMGVCGRLEFLAREGVDAAAEKSSEPGGHYSTDAPYADLTELADVLNLSGRSLEAEAVLRHSWPAQEARLGETAVATYRTMRELALVLRYRSSFDEAAALLGEIVAREERGGRATSAEAVLTWNELASVLECQGRPSDAERWLERLHAFQIERLGEADQATVGTAQRRIDLYLRQGKAHDALDLVDRELSLPASALGPLSWRRSDLIVLRASALLAAGRAADAERALLDHLARARDAGTDGGATRLRVLRALRGQYEAVGRDVEAGEIAGEIRRLESDMRPGLPLD